VQHTTTQIITHVFNYTATARQQQSLHQGNLLLLLPSTIAGQVGHVARWQQHLNVYWQWLQGVMIRGGYKL
jgi:hypothetical protein